MSAKAIVVSGIRKSFVSGKGTLPVIEQSLMDPRGLPGREWYQHMIYAPGLHTGYGVKTLPGIREAIEERRWDEANQYIGVVSHVLNAYSARMDRAIAAP